MHFSPELWTSKQKRPFRNSYAILSPNGLLSWLRIVDRREKTMVAWWWDDMTEKRQNFSERRLLPLLFQYTGKAITLAVE